MDETFKIIGWLFLVSLIVGGFYALLGGEREGTVNYSDCREVVQLKSDTLQKFYKKFTCEYIKSNDGKTILGGTCVHIDTDSSLLTSNSSCKTAFVYQKEPDIKCPDTVNGFLDVNGKCMCNTNYQFNNTSNKCEFDNSKVTISCNYGNQRTINGNDSGIQFSPSDFDASGNFTYDFDKNTQLQQVCQITGDDLNKVTQDNSTLFNVYLAR